MHKSRDVSFKNATSKDVLEVSIGTGPCTLATLTIVIRGVDGAVLYSYVAPFKRHTGLNIEGEGVERAATMFVDELIRNGVASTRALPPYLEPNAYWDEHHTEIKISRQAYEELRRKPRPMFEHGTHYEGWQTVIYDEAKEEAVLILAGGA